MKCTLCDNEGDKIIPINGKYPVFCDLCYKRLFYHFKETMFQMIDHSKIK